MSVYEQVTDSTKLYCYYHHKLCTHLVFSTCFEYGFVNFSCVIILNHLIIYSFPPPTKENYCVRSEKYLPVYFINRRSPNEFHFSWYDGTTVNVVQLL